MKSLYLNHFKAFNHEVELDCPNGESVLVYGENGSGKSSLYDAFRLFYFKEKIFHENIPANIIEGRVDEELAVISSFSYDIGAESLELLIDDVKFTDYTHSPADQVYLISYSDLHPSSESEDVINIRRLIEKAYLNCEYSMNELLDIGLETYIVDKTNTILKDNFYIEDMTLSASLTDDGLCTLAYRNRVNQKKEHLSRYFNEAAIHLVRFIILMEFISFVHNANRPALLVMDDCFNSLDATNRTFVMRYLFNNTKSMQKVIMTHSLSYFNLMSHILNTEHSSENWVKYVLCMIDGRYHFTSQDVSSVSDIMTKRQQGYYSDSAQLGNAIRQQFELLVYRLSMLCNLGAMEDSKNLLDQLCRPNQNIYLSVDDNRQIKTATHLVDEIYKCLTNGVEYKIVERLKNKIEEYRANDIFQPLKPVLKELRLLQKVALHQASHGHEGLPPVQSKEFDVSLSLLKKLEEAIHRIKTVDVSTI